MWEASKVYPSGCFPIDQLPFDPVTFDQLPLSQLPLDYCAICPLSQLTFWRCAHRKRCPARATTLDNNVQSMNENHDHPPDHIQIKVDKLTVITK